MRKKMVQTLVVLALLLAVGAELSRAQLQMPRPSPKATVTQTVGLTDVTISYSRPGAKGRAIWGSLVPYNQVWRAGANEATIFTLSDDVLVEGKKLAKGSYSLHAIPTADTWTVIFNKVAEQWGSYSYKQEEDALRVTVKSRKGPFVERMRFSVEDMTDSTATVVLAWENLEVPFGLQVNTTTKALASAKSTFSPRALFTAAQMAVQGKNMELANKYLNAAMAIEENYQNTSTKANWCAQAGNVKEAVLYGDKAVALGKAAQQTPKDLADLEKNLAAWKKKKK
jgi:hypothetical protein